MQKGFVSLEVILAALIVSVLAAVIIPKTDRIIDKVALDYETKRLYTDMRFVQSFDRMTNMLDTHFKNANDNSINMIVRPEGYTFETNEYSKLRGSHDFSYGVNASKKNGTENWILKFNYIGKESSVVSDHLTLSSRQGKDSSYIVFDSVGRFRGSRTKSNE